MPPIVQKQSDNTKYNRINQIYTMLKNNTHGMTITELANELDDGTYFKDKKAPQSFLVNNKFKVRKREWE